MYTRRRALGIAFAVVSGALVAATPRPTVDNSIGALLETDGAPAERYRTFQEYFGTDELVLVRIEASRPADALELARRAQDILQKSEAVEDVVGPWQAYPDLCEALVDPVAKDLLEPEEVEHTLSGPLTDSLPLLELDPPSAVVVGFGRVASIQTRARLRDALEALRADAERRDAKLAFAGPPLLNLYLDEAGRAVQRTALPLLLVVAVGLMLLTTRSWRITLVLLVPVGLGVALADALLSLSGGHANVMVDIVKPLLFVLLLAAGLHVAVRYVSLRREGVDVQDAAWGAARDKGRAVAVALLTTSIGFGSLALSDVAPIRTFGALSAAGLLLGIPSVLLTLPTLLGLLARRTPAPTRASLDGLARGLVRFGLAHPRSVLAVGLVGIVGGAVAAPRLETEPHAIRYFAPDHPLRADYQAIEAAGLGLSSVEVVLTASAAWGHGPDDLAGVERLRARAAELPGVKSALALPLVLREANHQVRRQDSLPDEAFAERALEARPSQARVLESDGGRRLRLSLLIETLDADALDRLEADIAKAAAEDVPGKEITFTGSYPLLLRAQRSLLTTLRDSLLTTLLLMELVLLVFLRRPLVALVALVPNVLPVAVNFCVMALVGIPVDLGTSMTAAVALGIAVDDTLHVAVSWDPHDPEALVARAGRAIVLSSLVIGLGFGALVSSDFGPTRSFGLLAGFAMLTALLADLMLLPPLLRWVDRRSGSGGSAA